MASVGVEGNFDASFTASLALREKQIQQSYRPIIGVHKWFARRPGTVLRSLLLAEFNGKEPLRESFWHPHELRGLIADPFMGGGTGLYEANRLGFNVLGVDINPMAWWIVRQSLGELDLEGFRASAKAVIHSVEDSIGDLYKTSCSACGELADVKYFLWVKTSVCPGCGDRNDLFPGYLLAEDERHPLNVLACAACGALNEFETVPTLVSPAKCSACKGRVCVEGTARNGSVVCRGCEKEFRYPSSADDGAVPEHRLWAIEYRCEKCKPGHKGRFFKAPDEGDRERVEEAKRRLLGKSLPIPDDEIPPGDETARLHRWGYRRYRDMFNERQLLGLGLLFQRIARVRDRGVRQALLTVFSDFLRYQNMLARYDTYALKCQDIFSVHGFPVGLVQCENSLLGIPRVGSGSFRHFVEKYGRAKEYCEAPFETQQVGTRKRQVPVTGERIRAQLVKKVPSGGRRKAMIACGSATAVHVKPRSLDGVFTDPPYFGNVQYAELMDFCYVWLRQALHDEFAAFELPSTRSSNELTGNTTAGRDIEHFTAGISEVFCRFARGLKRGRPFVFTYHHNDPLAYVPLVVAILDAGLACTATLPAAAEMSASLHILGTDSSILDSVFVCRPWRRGKTRGSQGTLVAIVSQRMEQALRADAKAMSAAGIALRPGDLRCLAAGHFARLTITELRQTWRADLTLAERMRIARTQLERFSAGTDLPSLVAAILKPATQADVSKDAAAV